MSMYIYVHICNVSDPFFTNVFREIIATLDVCITLRKPLVCFDILEANKYILENVSVS